MNKSLWLVLVPVTVGILAVDTGNILFKLGVPLSCTLILLLTLPKKSADKTFYFIIIAFVFSMLGDWFLSNKSGREFYFIYGIAAYFLAHLGYSLYAMKNGALNRTALLILLIIFLPYFYFMLHPAIADLILKSAVFLYLLISVLALSLAFGLEHTPRAKWLFVCGILLIVFSDTIISFTEFLNFRALNFLILPTYYMAHVSITASLILKGRTF
jgi:uncharacterized membrane protein YhhN